MLVRKLLPVKLSESKFNLLSNIAMRSHSTAHADVIIEPEAEMETAFQGSSSWSSTKSFDQIPGPKGLPLVGNTLMYSKLGPYSFEKILENRLNYMRKYGKIYKEKLGTMWMVNLFDPTDLATMFRLEGKYPSRGKIANLEKTYLMRNKKLLGFAFIDGPEWARQRGCIQRLMMHPEGATKYLGWQMPVARDFTDHVDGLRQDDGFVPDLYENLFKYTMESIGAVCFGERIGAFDGESENAIRLASAISETLFCFRSCMFNFPWYQYLRTPMYRRFEKAADNMRQIMRKYVKSVEDRTLKKRKTSSSVAVSDGSRGGHCPHLGSHRPPQEGVKDDDEQAQCVYELLSSDSRVSEELGVNLIMALLRTGIDSTGNALAFLLHNLASNPDKQDLLYREIQQHLPPDGVPTSETLQEMTYLKACLKESFRLHYPVYGGSGRVMPEDTTFSGYRVPKGVFIFANLAAMSRMEEYFPRPLEYHPERWLRDERSAMGTDWPQDPGYICLPFSHGQRACPGRRLAEQGLYTAAIAMVQKFRLTRKSNSPLGMIHMPFTIPDRPLDILFHPRHPGNTAAFPKTPSLHA